MHNGAQICGECGSRIFMPKWPVFWRCFGAKKGGVSLGFLCFGCWRRSEKRRISLGVPVAARLFLAGETASGSRCTFCPPPAEHRIVPCFSPAQSYTDGPFASAAERTISFLRERLFFLCLPVADLRFLPKRHPLRWQCRLPFFVGVLSFFAQQGGVLV